MKKTLLMIALVSGMNVFAADINTSDDIKAVDQIYKEALEIRNRVSAGNATGEEKIKLAVIEPKLEKVAEILANEGVHTYAYPNLYEWVNKHQGTLKNWATFKRWMNLGQDDPRYLDHSQLYEGVKSKIDAILNR